MNYRVWLREEAELDLTEAANWYEIQSPGLGHSFLDEVESTFKAIGERPLSFPQVYRETHRALITRFPFAIFYRLIDQDIIVIAVMHGSRHPSKWKKRT